MTAPWLKSAYIPEEKHPISMTNLIDIYGRQDPRIQEAFADGGPLSKMPGYVRRDQQIRLAMRCMDAFRLRKVLLGEAGTGCIEGSSVISVCIVNADGNCKDDCTLTIDRLYERFHRIPARKPALGRNCDPILDESWFFMTVSLGETHFNRRRILDVVDSGLKECLELTTDTGRKIQCTPDHLFFTPDRGWIACQDLAPDDVVFVNSNTRSKNGRQPRTKRIYWMVKSHPSAPLKSVYEKSTGRTYDYRRISRARAVIEASMNGMSPIEYRKLLNRAPEAHDLACLQIVSEGMEVHHKDENPGNDDLANLEVLTREQHHKVHQSDSSKRILRIPTKEMVKSIQSVGIRQTYDLAMEQEPNFVANGFVVHNSGKSLAVLVPAIEHAMRTGTKVCISTATNTLLDQYKNQDLPALQRYLGPWLQAKYGRNFTWATLKGRTNFYCLAKDAENDEVNTWLEATQTGDLAELPFEINSKKYYPLKLSITSDSDECPGRMKCISGPECYFYQAKDAADSADILLTNHAMIGMNLLMDVKLGRQLLPQFGAIVIDEAHQFSAYVQNQQEEVIGRSRIERIAKKLRTLGVATQDLYDSSEAFFGYLDKLATQEKTKITTLPLALLASRDCMSRVCEIIEGALSIKEAPSAEPLARSVERLRRALLALDARDSRVCSWIQRGAAREDLLAESTVALHTVPVDISRFLEENLWSKMPAILTSATLATGAGDFSAVIRELGIPGHPLEVQVDSPFDWHKNALYIFPSRGLRESDMERKRGESFSQAAARWAGKIAPILGKCLDFTGGHAFVLCTSIEVARCLFEMRGAYPSMIQGQLSKQGTVDWFESTPGAVLYATDSFGEGVDIKRDLLRLVFLDKIPFPNPSDPLEKAKADTYGQGWFQGYHIPYAVQRLKQRVGRLLRRDSSRGIVVCTDPRFWCKGYGKTLAACLPGDAVAAISREKTNVSEFLKGGKGF